MDKLISPVWLDFEKPRQSTLRLSNSHIHPSSPDLVQGAAVLAAVKRWLLAMLAPKRALRVAAVLPRRRGTFDSLPAPSAAWKTGDGTKDRRLRLRTKDNGSGGKEGFGKGGHKVRDITLADWGWKEISMAESSTAPL